MNLMYFNSQLALKLQINYPGGIQQFLIDGGRQCTINSKPMELHLYHPDIPKDLLNTLENLCKDSKIKFFYTNVLNSKEVSRPLIDLIKNFQSVLDLINPTYVINLITTLSTDSMQALKNGLEKIPELHNLIILKDSRVIYRVSKKKSSPIESISPSMSPTRNEIIQKDEITNLVIALNDLTVEEFLKRI